MTTSPSTPTPTVPKTPFLLADGLVLLVVLLLVWTGSTPLGPIEKTGIALCLTLGGVITATPFVIDYRRRKEPAAPAPVVSENAPVASEPALSAPQAVSVEPAAIPAEPPVWVAEFQALRSRLDALEQSLANTATTAHAGLRQLLDEHLARETQSSASARETLQRTLADTLLAAARNAFAAEVDRLLARLDEQSAAALAALDARSTALAQERVAAEIAAERAASARRSAAAATLVLESSPAAAPSGKSRLGRGLESLITSPQAKPAAPVVAEPPPAAQLSLPEVEPTPAPAIPPPAPEHSTPPPPPVAPKPEPVALDPFFIPANGYADLASAMDAGNASASKRR